MRKKTVLIIGASRGLGLALTRFYELTSDEVIVTVRSLPEPSTFDSKVRVIEGIDLSRQDVGQKLIEGLNGTKLDIVIIVAGLLKPEVC